MNYDHLLGTLPDNQLAKQLGISRQAVSERRKKLGIAVYVPPPKPPKPKPKMGRPTIGDRPMTGYERLKKTIEKKKKKFSKDA